MGLNAVLLWLPLTVSLVSSGATLWHFSRSSVTEPPLKLLSRALEAFAVVVFSALISNFSVTPVWSWWVVALILVLALGFMVARWPLLVTEPGTTVRGRKLPPSTLRFGLTIGACALLAIIALW